MLKESVKGKRHLATPQFLAVGKESRCSRPFQAQARRVLYSSSQGHSSFIGPGGMPRSQARREIQGKSPAPARRIGTSAPFCGKKANPLSADPIPPMLMSITPFWPALTKAFLKTGGWQESWPFEIASVFRPQIDDLHWKSSIPGKNCHLKSSGEDVEKALEMNFEIFWGVILSFLI